MASYRIGYIFLLICAAVFSQVYSGHLSAVVFLSLLIMPVISLISAIIQRLCFKFTFDGMLQKAERGDNLKIRITVKNRGIIPMSNVLITGILPGTVEKRDARLIFSLRPFQKKSLYMSYGAEFRGEYEYMLDRVYFYDYFKIFRISKKLNITKKILILPKLYDTNALEPLATSSDEESQVQINANMGGERSFIRKYADGDELKNIHWKLSSKQEDYVVWQSAKSHNVENIVICDTSNLISTANPVGNTVNSGTKKGRKNNKSTLSTFRAVDRTNCLYTDSIWETALAIAFYNAKNDRKTYISYFDGAEKKRIILPAENPQQIYEAVEIAARAKSYSGNPKFTEEAKTAFIENSGKGIVMITHCMDMRIATLAEEVRAYSEFGLIIVGNPEENVINYIKGLSGVRFACINPENPSVEIPEAIEAIYNTNV